MNVEEDWDETLKAPSLHSGHITYSGSDKKREWWGCADCDIQMSKEK